MKKGTCWGSNMSKVPIDYHVRQGKVRRGIAAG